jgi:cytochrome c5
VAMFFLARVVGQVGHEQMMLAESAIAERIAPVGRVRTTADEGDPAEAPRLTVAAAPRPAPSPEAAEGRPPEEVVQAACAACHQAGVAGAPKSDDTAAWGERYELGLEVLVASVISGKGAMPPRAGQPNLTDGEIRGAVLQMLEDAGVEVAEAVGPDEVAEAAEETVAAVAEQAEELAEPAAEAVGEAAETAERVVEEEPAEAREEVEEEAAKEEPETVAAAGDAAAGEGVYQRACLACHLTGAAGAPKLDATEAWSERYGERGFDGFVQSVIDGKGAMPPRAGQRSLTDDDIRNAIQYILEKSEVDTSG